MVTLLMDIYLQGINMKFLLKALFCALLTTTLLFNISLVSAEPKAVTIQQVVNLNKSTLDDLVTLKGVGQKKAQAILAYREQIGAFKSITDLTKVKGIGEKILIDNKERLKI
ncbi:MAG: helix-hairpin-helix domain-containing protein [Colwellia sp.]|nr:helix-hairpin-helix domain-containing protein [Colwellia sp.]